MLVLAAGGPSLLCGVGLGNGLGGATAGGWA